MTKLLLLSLLTLAGCASHPHASDVLPTQEVGVTKDGCKVMKVDLWYASRGTTYYVRCPITSTKEKS